MNNAGSTLEVAVTRSLPGYQHNLWIADPERRRRFVEFIDPDAAHTVLDVPSGPGYNALAFAQCAGRVIGIDSSEQALLRAERMRSELRLGCLEFMVGEATEIPFDDNLFDIVTSSMMLHHFEEPDEVLAEMVRVCRPGGRLAIEDLVAPDDPIGAAHRDDLERLRDVSHVRFLSRVELADRVTRHGVTVVATEGEDSERRFSEWLAVTRPDPEVAAEVRRRLLDREASDRAGLHVRERDGDLVFVQPLWRLNAVKPER